MYGHGLGIGEYLHSNMVRFIMNDKLRIEAEIKYIYILIWLDLL